METFFAILIVLGLAGVIHKLEKIYDVLRDIQRRGFPDPDDEDEDFP